MDFKRLVRRRSALLLPAAFTILIAMVLTLGRSFEAPSGVTVMAAPNGKVPLLAVLSTTNRASRDYVFSCYLEVQTESGWSAVGEDDEIRTLRYFRKGQVVLSSVNLPSKLGLFRFHCFYEPLSTSWSTRAHNWLMGIKLPGTLGTFYRGFLGRLQPWPKSFYSNVFENKLNAQRTALPLNGGPTTRLGNSGVTEGPPSVS